MEVAAVELVPFTTGEAGEERGGRRQVVSDPPLGELVVLREGLGRGLVE